MITSIVEIRNFLPDPDALVGVAKGTEFYSIEQHPDLTERTLVWEGRRSESLYRFDKELSDKLFHAVFESLARRMMGDDKYGFEYKYVGNSVFHYMTENDVYSDSWIHDDRGCVFAGVLYLNKETKEDTGTVVFVDGEPHEVKNEYNKLVLYPANLKHSSRSGFGSDVSDARLTLGFFISSVSFSIRCTE